MPTKTVRGRVALVDATMQESEFLAAVIKLAHGRGWLCAHFRPAVLRSGKWATHMAGDPGFPDLVFARGGRIILAELKSAGGRLSAAQQRWLDAMAGQPGVFVWRPADLDAIERVLE